MRSIVITIREKSGGIVEQVLAQAGSTLRSVLLNANKTPYRGVRRGLNCHGFGLCGGCLVTVNEDGKKWVRRSCQIQCFQSMEIELQ